MRAAKYFFAVFSLLIKNVTIVLSEGIKVIDRKWRNADLDMETNIEIKYREIKNINLYVKPPDGKVLVTAPKGTSKKEITRFVDSKRQWILKSQKKVRDAEQSRKENEVPKKAQKDQLYQSMQLLAQKWEPIMGVQASRWTIREMKTRWGSCTIKTGAIRINSRLFYYPPKCLEYVVVHELCHLLEPSHNERFQAYMTQFMPDWKERRASLREV